MAAPRLGMVILDVADVARSLAFYRRLGLEFPPGSDAATNTRVTIGEVVFLWTSEFVPSNDPGRERPAGGSRILVEFFVEAEAEVDRLYAELTAAGYSGHRPPFRTTFGAYMAMVDDPDGNTVLITAG